jgi:hypothetical protein
MVDSVIWNSVSVAVTVVGAAAGRDALAVADVAGLEAAGWEAAGLEAAGWEAAGLEAAGWEAAGLEAAGWEAAGLEAAGLEAAGVEAAGVEAAVDRAAAVGDEDELDEHAARTPAAITVTGMANQVPR